MLFKHNGKMKRLQSFYIENKNHEKKEKNLKG